MNLEPLYLRGYPNKWAIQLPVKRVRGELASTSGLSTPKVSSPTACRPRLDKAKLSLTFLKASREGRALAGFLAQLTSDGRAWGSSHHRGLTALSPPWVLWLFMQAVGPKEVR
jgi:hypothetical protein